MNTTKRQDEIMEIIRRNEKSTTRRLVGSVGEVTISHEELFHSSIDLEGRDLIIGFNEPTLKKSRDSLELPDLDSKLNARLPSYFLPAVHVACMQKKRPRLIIVSGIFAALRWNARSDRERKIMLVNNNLKIDYIKSFFETFFLDVFSVIEFRNAYDFLKISERKLDLLCNIFEKKYPKELSDVKIKLLQYKHPKEFAQGVPNERELDRLSEINKEELNNAFKYALIHIFALGDINLGWDFSHNSIGYCSIGEHNEAIFNIVRKIGYEILKEAGGAFFDQEIFTFENMKIVINDPERVPPAYNGAFRKSGGRQRVDEVTFENNKELSYYNERPRLQTSMNYIYSLIPEKEYEVFWHAYRAKYFDLKGRYQEAYDVKNF